MYAAIWKNNREIVHDYEGPLICDTLAQLSEHLGSYLKCSGIKRNLIEIQPLRLVAEKMGKPKNKPKRVPSIGLKMEEWGG